MPDVALVHLDEGPQILMKLIKASHDGIEPGIIMEAVFEPVTDAITLVKFRPVS